MARKLLKVTIINPQAIPAASKRFTEAVYNAYMGSLVKEEKFIVFNTHQKRNRLKSPLNLKDWA